jgi:two-component sensor histidine kinase
MSQGPAEPPPATAFGRGAGLRVSLVGIAYFAVAYIGLQLASIHPSATPIWPATGLAIAAVLLWGYRVAPAIFIAAFLVNFITAGSAFTSTAIAFGNTLEALATAYFVKMWIDGERVFNSPAGVGKFALISAATTTISATIGVGSLILAGLAEAGSAASVWLTWWLGDFAGAIVVTPVVLLWLAAEGKEEAFQGRLMNLAATHRLLGEANWESASLTDLVRAAVEPYCPPEYDGCEFSGDDLRIPGAIATSLTMVLHELATNAAKHGALGSKGSKLKIKWRQENDAGAGNMLHLSWEEAAVPLPKPQSGPGYGTALIDATIDTLRGRVEREQDEGKLQVRISIPLN